MGQSIKYIAAERASDPKVMGIVANGYPTKSLGELGLQSKVEGYYATKIALWCYIIPGWDISGVTVNPNLSGAARTQAQRVLAAAQKIYKNGSWWTSVPNAGLTTSADQEYAYPVTIDGVAYKQQIITVHSETWVCNYEVQVAVADPGAVPEGTRIVNLDNQDISVVTTTNTGKGYDGQFKVLYPADSVAGESGSVQFTLRADVYRYGVYYASCAEVDKYGVVQNYICDTDPTRGVGVSAISKYSADEVPEEPDTGLKIVKVESGTETPLAGAVFAVKGPDGDTVGSFSSGTDGTVLIPLTQSGNFTVTEILSLIHICAAVAYCRKMLHLRYTLQDGLVLPIPTSRGIPKRLRNTYLWLNLLLEDESAIHWIYVAGFGWLSPQQFTKRPRGYSLVLKYRADCITEKGEIYLEEMEPWEYQRLLPRSKARLQAETDSLGGTNHV